MLPINEITVFNITKDGETTPLRLELPLPAEQIAATAGVPDGSSPGMTNDYLFRLAELNGRIAGAQKITALNAFAGRLTELSEYERVLFAGAVEITHSCSLEHCERLLNGLDCFDLTPGIGDHEAIGRQYAGTALADVPPEILVFLDYKELGKLLNDDYSNRFIRGHLVSIVGEEFQYSTPKADPLQDYCLKLRLTSDADPDGVWIKFPLREETPGGDVERGDEIRVALSALKADSLDNCRAAECVCKYPSLNRCLETHADVKLTDLVWIARNFACAEDELTRYGKDMYEKLAAALELEDCRNLDLAAGVTQNLHCYDFGCAPESFAEACLRQHRIDPFLHSCFDLKALGESLMPHRGIVSVTNGLIARNDKEFVYDYYQPAPQTPEPEQGFSPTMGGM